MSAASALRSFPQGFIATAGITVSGIATFEVYDHFYGEHPTPEKKSTGSQAAGGLLPTLQLGTGG